MNRLAIGTAQFGLTYGIANQVGQVARPVAKAMLEIAAKYDIDTLDTAMAYGDSEACLGEIGTKGFRLVTKLPGMPDDCVDVGSWVRDQVEASLARLGVSSTHGLLLHRPEQLLGPHGRGLFQALQRLKESGQVTKMGISIYSPMELEALVRRYHFDLVQAPFNLVDRRLHRSGWLQRLKDDGVEVHTRSVFLQGLLLMPRSAIPPQFSPWSILWERWHAWLLQNQVTAVQACLSYALSFPEIERVIVGADSESQLTQIIGAANRSALDALPDLYCDEEDLINPARWSQ